ncbi:transposase, partial [Candidatus Uhrbacteria bacterium CG_4_9_14_0_8_um_filter_41_16]
MNQLYKRQSLRLAGWNYASPGFYYITICIDKNEDGYLFGDIHNGKMYLNKFGQIVNNELLNTEILRDNVRIHDFVVMPNHLHVIVQITYEIERFAIEQFVGAWRAMPLRMRHESKRTRHESNGRQFAKPIANSLPTIIGAFKSASTREINILRQTPGERVWQRNYYEHIIRDYYDFLRISEYIQNNPKNWEKNE